MERFTGFPKTGLDFLVTLSKKDKTWFDAHRGTYETDVVGPAKAFVSAMGEALADRISPAIEAQPKTNGSIAPINNDLRFNPKAAPYKNHLMFRFWEGLNKKIAPTLMIRLSPKDGIGFASGVVLADLGRWRERIDDERAGAAFAADLKNLVRATRADLVGEALKKVPKPYAEDHPRGDLLRHKGFQVRWSEDVPRAIGSVKFVGWCADRLVKASAVHRWLVANLG